VRSSVTIRVRLADTDARGCLADARVLVFFEVGRATALRELGLPYGEMVARGCSAPVVEARLRHHAPAYPDDLLVLRTWATDVGRLRFTCAYELRRERDDALIATGETVHVCLDTAAGRPARLPDWLGETLDRLRAPAREDGAPPRA
jgi:acyl-CoA thioester hydrolase